MFARIVTRGLLMFAALLVSMSAAQAGKVPIPCTNEKIVRVAELPEVVEVGKGQRLGLGYLYTGCFSGKWIGHVGSDEKYNDKVGALLLAAMTEANRGVAPTEPGIFWGLWNHPWQFFVEWLWLFAIGVIVVEITKNLVRYGTIKNPHNVAALKAASGGAVPAQPVARNAALDVPPTEPAPRVAAPLPRRQPRELQVSGAPTFGKRV